MRWGNIVTTCLLALRGAKAAITLDINSEASVKAAAKQVAADMLSYYTGDNPGDTPGNLPDPYYWWEAGAMFGTMINYWYFTGDTTYNAMTKRALLHQTGEDGDYMPLNQTKTLGNDDQSFWGLAAMMAAETKFENPEKNEFQWLELAQGVFNTQVPRWDAQTCGGGLRWQIFQFNSGFTYKNSISNGCFFNLASRLALFTGNQTYADYADKTWKWMTDIGLMTSDYKVFDGTQVTNNCASLDHNQWTYNVGVFMLGSAAMYNFTNGSPVWEERVKGLLKSAQNFFQNGVLFEGCESSGKCNIDQRSFKGYLVRWLAATAELAPFTHDTIMPLLTSSAKAAVKTCTAGASGSQCGLQWTMEAHDGSLGVGEQMSVLEVIQSHLLSSAPGWASEVKGTSISVGNANAGSGSGTHSLMVSHPSTVADRVGAGFLTLLMLVGVIAGSVAMAIGD
ncbi:mannosidase GPI-anchored membrane protein [Blumeria graminis f. sp. tritici 96224]|uniref:Mannan endo-1,6-alpha-mannosidase n=3 Tax=Blumeria graminis TaxID=34373 RepID=A0A381LG61_BLUGR|nr:mannosidase GPI-anchored membrane protein [Blumeria graminis f. sp. tritici 96224]